MNIAPVGSLKPASALVSSPEPRRLAGSFEPGKRPGAGSDRSAVREGSFASLDPLALEDRPPARRVRFRHPSKPRRNAPCPRRPAKTRRGRPTTRWRTRISARHRAWTRTRTGTAARLPAPPPSLAARKTAQTRRKPGRIRAPAKPERSSRLDQPAFSVAGAGAGVRAAHWMFRYDHFTSVSLRPHWVFSPWSRP